MSLSTLKAAIRAELQDVDVLRELTFSQFIAMMELIEPEKVRAAKEKVQKLIQQASRRRPTTRAVPHS